MYYIIKDNVLYQANNANALKDYGNNIKTLPVDYEVGKYIVENNELVLNQNYEAEQAQAEKERIAKLFLTGADVERGIYQAKGMDFDDIMAFVMANPPQGLDVKALRIELKANHFYRGNPYVEAVGALLGFTSDQLNKFFEFNDYTYLIPEPDVNNSEELEEQEPVINGDTVG